MKKTVSMFAMTVSMVATSSIAAETCSELNGRLTFNSNGSVVDTKTGLTWLRCSFGQEWTGSACTGNSAKHTLDNANAAVKSSGFAAQGYRLPTVSELLDITAYDCGEPAVAEQWKSIEPGFYWTSEASFGGFQNTVLMTTGEDYPMSSDVEAWVLLVK